MRALAAGAPSFSQLGTSHLFNLPQNNIGQHPAVSLLKNLIIGSCNLKQYKDEQKSLLTDLDASKETIFGANFNANSGGMLLRLMTQPCAAGTQVL